MTELAMCGRRKRAAARDRRRVATCKPEDDLNRVSCVLHRVEVFWKEFTASEREVATRASLDLPWRRRIDVGVDVGRKREEFGARRPSFVIRPPGPYEPAIWFAVSYF